MQYYMKKFVPVVLIVIICLFIIVFMQTREEYDEAVDEIEVDLLIEKEEPREETIEEDNEIIVDIKGEVHHPGVYTLDAHARVHDLIHVAGGFTNEAAAEHINLAQKVYDEMVVIVPKVGEEATDFVPVQSSNQASPSNGVAINRASVEEMTQLSGIGPAKAEAIVSYREENGPFKKVEDLLEVSGIGEKTLENIRDEIIIP